MNILFAGHDFKFAQHLIDHYQNDCSFQVFFDDTGGHSVVDMGKSGMLLEKADFIFCEWALGNAEFYSRHKKENQKLIVRIHQQEFSLPYFNRIIWEKVDRVILISPLSLERFLSRFPFLKNKSRLIYNMVDCDKLDQEKNPEAGYHLGMLGILPKIKAPHRALEILTILKNHDDRFTLFIKSKIPGELDWLKKREPELKYYDAFFNSIDQLGLSESVIFEPFGSDVPEWFRKIGFILSPSDREGSHQSVAEGMSAGSVPVIRNWAGASQIYPGEFIYDSTDDAVAMITGNLNIVKDPDRIDNIKSFARKNFDKAVILKQYDNLFGELYADQSTHEAIGASENEWRILHLASFPLKKDSGNKTRILEEIQFLRRSGVYVCLVCFLQKGDFEDEQAVSDFRDLLLLEIASEVHLFFSAYFFDYFANRDTLPGIDDAIVSIIHKTKITTLHGHGLLATAHLCRLAKQTGSRVVLEIQDIPSEASCMQWNDKLSKKQLKEFTAKVLFEADHYLFPSATLEDYYKRKYRSLKKESTIIPNCLDTSKYKITDTFRAEMRKRLGIEEKLVLIYLGSADNKEQLLMAARILKKLSFFIPEAIMLFLIHEKDNKSIREAFRHWRIVEEQYVISQIPQVKRSSYLGLADLGLIPLPGFLARERACREKLSECLAAGVPYFIYSRKGGCSRLLNFKNLGISSSFIKSPLDWLTLIKMIRFIKKYRKNPSYYRVRCQNYADKNLDWNSRAQVFYKMYSSLIGRRI
jgi:glycosyltransferase involved in cell wall biosynthesis